MPDEESDPGSRSLPARRLVVGLLLVLAGAVWVVTWVVVGAWQGVLALAPLLSVASGLALLPLVVVATTRRSRIVAGLASGVLLLPTLPLGVLALHQAPLPAGGLRLLEWNAQDAPDALNVLEALTAQQAPDLVVVSQVPQLDAASTVLRQRYPFQASTHNAGAADFVAVLSTYPITAQRTDFRPLAGPGPGLRALVVDVALPSGPLRVVTAHPTRPLLAPGEPYGEFRDRQLDLLGQVVRDADAESTAPLLVTGDLNVTTREAAYARLRSATSLDDVVDRWRWAATGTWRPSRAGVPGVLGLDHVLHSVCLLPTGTVELWRTSGSQHAPLVTTLTDTCER